MSRHYMSTKDLDARGRTAVRGKLLAARASMWRDGFVMASVDMDCKDAPYLLNSMDEWLWHALQELRNGMAARAFKNAYADHTLKYVLNGGEGARSGRASSHNRFDYVCVGKDPAHEWKLQVDLQSESYSNAYQKSVRRGERSPEKRVSLREKYAAVGSVYYDKSMTLWHVEGPGWHVPYYPGDEQKGFFAEFPEYLKTDIPRENV